MLDLNNRVAIVTGAGRGLGRAHALLLARHGTRVVVNDINERAEDVVSEILAAGGEAVVERTSVTDEAGVAAMVDNVKARFGRIDILVNNAGILRDASFSKMTVGDFRAVIDTHVLGAFLCTKAVWETMREQKYGRIVMTTSSSGLYGNFGQANYSAAKMALVGLMQTLSIEGAKYGIHVNCLAPTAATTMTDAILPDVTKELLAPELVSPGLIALVNDGAPTRAILCAGAGHYKQAFVTLTAGIYVGHRADAADQIAVQWLAIGDRKGESIPESGAAQIHRELTAATGSLAGK